MSILFLCIVAICRQSRDISQETTWKKYIHPLNLNFPTMPDLRNHEPRNFIEQASTSTFPKKPQSHPLNNYQLPTASLFRQSTLGLVAGLDLSLGARSNHGLCGTGTDGALPVPAPSVDNFLRSGKRLRYRRGSTRGVWAMTEVDRRRRSPRASLRTVLRHEISLAQYCL